ncbi:hypothetical protein Barb4_04098 [Bacteroidales bacterium Barb4]|nr:hypothetical protein Barb4_04098 [Bacteroidales bacterium Barb4]
MEEKLILFAVVISMDGLASVASGCSTTQLVKDTETGFVGGEAGLPMIILFLSLFINVQETNCTFIPSLSLSSIIDFEAWLAPSSPAPIKIQPSKRQTEGTASE